MKPCVLFAAVKRTEKAMRNKLSVQHGGMDVAGKDKQWGKSKRGYYGADTEDYEVTVILTPAGSIICTAILIRIAQHSSMS